MEVSVQIDRASASLLAKLIAADPDDSFDDTLLAWLKTCLYFDGLTSIAYFDDSNPIALQLWSAHSETHSLMGTEYLNRAYLLDPFYNLHVQKRPEGVYRLMDVAPDQFNRTQYYNEYYRFTGTTDEMGMLFRPAEGMTVITSLDRNRQSLRRFSQSDLGTINTISPILSALGKKRYGAISTGKRHKELSIKDPLTQALRRDHAISLSPRQTEVALLVLKGHSSNSIGSILGISPQTVKVFRKQIYRRCNIGSQAELFKLLLPLIGS